MTAKIGTKQREWRKEAERKGWTVRLTGNGHLVFEPPEDSPDRHPVCVPGRGFKDNRGLPNARAQLRRQGLDV